MKLITSRDFRELIGRCTEHRFQMLRKHPHFPRPILPYPTARTHLYFEDEARAFIESLRENRMAKAS